jgi:hypothetical protein
MRVFISWSGGLSRSVARALREWLPLVVPDAEPWMSEEDIASGARWNEQMTVALEGSDFGIICLTSTNLERPWLLFEAGAIAKKFDVAHVVPLLIDLTPVDLEMPLASFQSRVFSEEGIRRLVGDMNAVREPPLPTERINKLFDALWSGLNDQITAAKDIDPPRQDTQTRRDAENLMGELVEGVRRMERRIDTLSLDSPFDPSAEQNLQRFTSELIDAVAELNAYARLYKKEQKEDQEVMERLSERFSTVLSLAQSALHLSISTREYRASLEHWQYLLTPPNERD